MPTSLRVSWISSRHVQNYIGVGIWGERVHHCHQIRTTSVGPQGPQHCSTYIEHLFPQQRPSRLPHCPVNSSSLTTHIQLPPDFPVGMASMEASHPPREVSVTLPLGAHTKGPSTLASVADETGRCWPTAPTASALRSPDSGPGQPAAQASGSEHLLPLCP